MSLWLSRCHRNHYAPLSHLRRASDSANERVHVSHIDGGHGHEFRMCGVYERVYRAILYCGDDDYAAGGHHRMPVHDCGGC